MHDYLLSYGLQEIGFNQHVGCRIVAPKSLQEEFPSIIYEAPRRGKLDNISDVVAFIGSDYSACPLCRETGEYADNDGNLTECLECCSRVIPFLDYKGERQTLDWNDRLERRPNGLHLYRRYVYNSKSIDAIYIDAVLAQSAHHLNHPEPRNENGVIRFVDSKNKTRFLREGDWLEFGEHGHCALILQPPFPTAVSAYGMPSRNLINLLGEDYLCGRCNSRCSSCATNVLKIKDYRGFEVLVRPGDRVERRNDGLHLYPQASRQTINYGPIHHATSNNELNAARRDVFLFIGGSILPCVTCTNFSDQQHCPRCSREEIHFVGVNEREEVTRPGDTLERTPEGIIILPRERELIEIPPLMLGTVNQEGQLDIVAINEAETPETSEAQRQDNLTSSPERPPLFRAPGEDSLYFLRNHSNNVCINVQNISIQIGRSETGVDLYVFVDLLNDAGETTGEEVCAVAESVLFNDGRPRLDEYN